jgi:hypothetical protein
VSSIFAVFDHADGSEHEILSSIPQALVHARAFDAKKVRMLGWRRIRPRAFSGDWYDLESGVLLKMGSYTTVDGSELKNPVLKNLDRVKSVSGLSPNPEAGSGGQFAYACANPPYRLKSRPREVQATFDEIGDFILPPAYESAIWDWRSPELPEASDYFAAGMEWWGAFLFSIHIPATKRLTIVAGSTTD